MTLKQGDVDILLGTSKTKSREKFAFLVTPIEWKNFLYIRKDDYVRAHFKSTAEFLHNKSRIRIVENYVYGTAVSALLLRQKELSNYIVAYGITIQTGNAYMMFSQQSVTQSQLKLFNKQLAKVKIAAVSRTLR